MFHLKISLPARLLLVSFASKTLRYRLCITLGSAKDAFASEHLRKCTRLHKHTHPGMLENAQANDGQYNVLPCNALTVVHAVKRTDRLPARASRNKRGSLFLCTVCLP